MIIGIDGQECYSMRCTTFFLCLLCASCVFHEEYPSDWSPLVISAKECPDISGTYEDVAKFSTDDNDRGDDGLRLSDVFLGSPLGFDAKLTISHPDSTSIQTSTSDLESRHLSHTLTQAGGDYSCKDGRIWLSDHRIWEELHLYAIGYEKAQVGFTKSEDGSLVGEIRGSAGGVVLLFIPVMGSWRDHILWKVAELKSND